MGVERWILNGCRATEAGFARATSLQRAAKQYDASQRRHAHRRDGMWNNDVKFKGSVLVLGIICFDEYLLLIFWSPYWRANRLKRKPRPIFSAKSVAYFGFAYPMDGTPSH